jgi:hypothetical protein
MYVRTWKDTEMVTTSDSRSSESTSNDGPEATPSEPSPAAAPSPAASGATEPPASPAPPPRAEPATPSRSRRNGPVVTRGQVADAVSGVRERLAAIVWIVCVVAAVILAAGALLIALDANRSNDLVHHIVGWAHDLDGPFNGMFTFDGDNAATKTALVNWGLAAVAWLIGGKIVSSVIRP